MISMVIIFSQIQIVLPSLVPITMQTLGIYLIGLILNIKESLFCVCVYLLMGLMGLPVFSGFQGGLSCFMGPSGGFLWSFIVMVMMIRALKKQPLVGLIFATITSYLMGMCWFSFILETNLRAAFYSCILPFLLGDSFKIYLAYKISFHLK